MTGTLTLESRNRLVANTYAKPLLCLDEELRLEIMHILLDSIKGEKRPEEQNNDLLTCFHGTWGEGTDVDSYCKELREGIGAVKEIEAW